MSFALHLTLMLALAGAAVLVRFVRWQFVLRRADVRLPTRPSLMVYLASLIGMATPWHLGEVIRVAFIRGRLGHPVRGSLVAFVLERLLDVVALAIIVSLTAGSRNTSAIIVTGVVSLALLAGFGAFGSTSAIRALRQPADLTIGVGMSLLAWSLFAAQMSVAASAFGLSLTIANAAHVFSASSLLGGFAFMPAGITTASALAVDSVQALGISANDASSAIGLVRLATVGTPVAVGAICFLALFTWQRRVASGGDAAAHFDEIALEYGNQFSGHIWDHLLERKIGFMVDALPPPGSAGIGLDLGCGLGIQCQALAKRGYPVVGMDISRGLAQQAKRSGVTTAVGSALELPFADQSLDFVYAVGVLHHLPDRQSQEVAYREVARVLRPGGRFLVHESNPRNPLFRFYLGYVFPVLKSIDEGVEWWISPDRWKKVPGLRLTKVTYFTFMPDFIPAWLLPPFRAMDRVLEASSLRRYSVHYLAVLEREAEPGGGELQRPTTAA